MTADAVTSPAVTPAPAAVPDTPDVKNVRDDLGDAFVSKFVEARTMIYKYEDKTGDKDADEVVPATAILVNILETVPQEKTRSAGYAEVLLVYGRVLFAFAKRDILRSAILGGDVEAEVLKSQLQDALQKKQAADVPSKNVEKAKAVPTVLEAGESKLEEKDAEADPKPAVESKDSEPKTEKKDTEAKDEKDTAGGKDEVKADVVEEEKKENAKKSDESEIVAADEDAIMPAEKAAAPTSNPDEVGDDGEGEQEDSNEMLTWEQLEYARTIFEQLGSAQRHRLPAVFEALGDLLLETDQSEKAAVEYAKALEILVANPEKSELRVISNLEYQRYIALRKEAPAEALAALKKAAEHFAKVTEASEKEGEKKEFEDILKTMTEEVEAFEAALPASALKEEQAKDEDTDVVTIVQPRRRVRKVVEMDSDEGETRAAKKARVAPETGGTGGEVGKDAEGSKNVDERANGKEDGSNGTNGTLSTAGGPGTE